MANFAANITVLHPLHVVTLANYKRFDDKTKEKGSIGNVKQIYAEQGVKGFYRGFGFTCIKEILKIIYRFGISKIIRLGFAKLFGEQFELSIQSSVEVSAGKLVLDLTTFPLIGPLDRYIGDQGKTYSSYFDCVKKIYNLEGWKGLYRGSWIGLLMNSNCGNN